MTDYFVIEPCSTSNALEVKLKGRRIDLRKASEALSLIGTVAAGTPVVLLSKIRNYSVSVYASGRMIVKGEKKLQKKEIKKLAYEMLDVLEKHSAILEVEKT
jgi:hypothetical protein